MSESASKQRLNRDTVGDNETIFDFLKRKKQFGLENTLNKSITQHSNTKPKAHREPEEEFPQTRDLSKYKTYQSNRFAQTARQTVTPKKIDFEEQSRPTSRAPKEAPPPQPGHNPRGKSFLSMISPIKNRSSSALEERKDPNQNENKARSGVKAGKSEQFTRGKVTKCINNIKDTVSSLNDSILKIKDKSHGLAILFNPVFNQLSNPRDPLAKQVGDLRNKLKAFETLVNGVPLQNCDQMVENFHRNLEDHVQSELHHLKRELEKEKQDHLSGIQVDKQAKIDKLNQEVKKMAKENELLTRRLEIAENSRGQIEEAVEEREHNHLEKMDRYKENFENSVEQLKARNCQLEGKLQAAQEQAREAEKNYKNERMVKENLDNRYREEISQITEVKDAYLLNEIMVLKAEFNADLSRINELHKVKEGELMERVGQREEELSQKMFEKGCDKQIESKILEEASQLKQENMQLKNKSECIVTDMYRMNEELFQHWMALKDIKLLSTRLGSFPQFRKIYADLMYNDHLFP